MSRLEEIGAIWKRVGQKGEYFTGSVMIDGIAREIRMFPNDYKKLDKHPDFKVFASYPDDQPAPAEPSIQHGAPLPNYPAEEINPADIPF